jgi:hypothetical protein
MLPLLPQLPPARKNMLPLLLTSALSGEVKGGVDAGE